MSFTGEIHSAEDIVSETFVRATEHCIVKKDMPVKAWFYKVTRNGALDWLKRKGRFEQNDIPEIIDESKDSNPESLVLQEENLREFEEKMDMLPELYRSVLVLKEFNDFSYAEIAVIIGVSLDNVKVLIYRAKQKLKEIYRRENDYGAKGQG